jgi:hypothetical protein
MANKPTKAEYEGFKKAVANPMTPAPIKQKLQSIIDQYSSEYEGGSETPKAEPKSRAGRKPSTTKKYKTLPKPKMVALITATKDAVEDMKAQLKKLGYNPEEVDALNGNQAFAILEELKSKMVGKPKRTATPRATKKTATDIEKAKAEIKAKTGKTEAECEAIIEQYRALRTKAQEGKRKAEQATATNKKRVAKLEDKGDLIEGTNVKTADAVIETTAQDVAEKIEQQIEAVEEKAEKEAVAEVAKDNTKKTPTQKKQAVEAKVEKKVKEKTRVIVKKVVIDTTALLTSIATSLGKFDKDSQKEFLIKLRSDIDKLLAKYAFGGMTDGAVQMMNIQQSNLSASSVNPTMFAKGGGVGKIYALVDKFDANKQVYDQVYYKTNNYNEIIGYIADLKNEGEYDSDMQLIEVSSNGRMRKFDSSMLANGGGVDGGAKIRIDSVDMDVYEDSYEEGEGSYVIGYSRDDLVGKLVNPKELVSFLSKELFTNDSPSNYSVMDGAIFTSQLVDEDSNKPSERQKAEWKKGDLTLYSENYRIGVSIIHPTETTDEELSKLTGIGLYKKGGKIKMSSRFAKGGGVDGVNFEKTYKDYRYSKGYSRGWSYYDKNKTTKKYLIDLVVDDETHDLYHETNDSREILGYVEALKKNAINLFADFDGIEVRDAIDGDYRRILYINYRNGEWSDAKIIRNMNSLRLQDVLINYGFEPQRGNMDEADVDFYEEIDWFTFRNEDFTAIVNNDGVEILNDEGEVMIETNDATELDIYLDELTENELYAKGGMTEHGLRVGDRIWGESKDLNQVFVKNNDEWKTINLDKGQRFAKGGKLWIDTKGKGGLKGVKPSRKNTFRNEAVKRGISSGTLASRVIANPSRYKGINPKSAQLVKNMGVRKHGGSIGDILRNRRGE